MWQQHPRCSSKTQNTDITLFLFLFSVKHVSALHCATKRRQFRRVWGRAECSQLARYTNLSAAESEGTPTNHFLRTGHSLQGASRSPASIGRGVCRRPELFPSQVHPYGAHTQKRRWVTFTRIRCQCLPRVFLVAGRLSVKCRLRKRLRAAVPLKD